MKIRITGLPGEVESAAARLGEVLTVLESSGLRPRRGNSRLVSLYLDAAPKPWPGAVVVDLTGDDEFFVICDALRGFTARQRFEATGEPDEFLNEKRRAWADAAERLREHIETPHR